MSSDQESNKVDSLLTSEDKVNGFSIVVNGYGNIMLLKWNKPIAHFSASLTEAMVKAFLEIVEDYERDAKGKRKPNQNE